MPNRISVTKEDKYPFINKVIIGFALLIAVFIGNGIFSYFAINTLGGLLAKTYRHPLEVSNAALRASLEIAKIHRSMKDVVLSDNPAHRQHEITLIEAGVTEVYKELNLIQAEILGPEGLELTRQARQAFTTWRPIRDEVIALVTAGERQKAALITQRKGADHVHLLEQRMLALSQYARNKADGFVGQAKIVEERVALLVPLLVILGTFLSLSIVFITIKEMMHSLNLRLQAEQKTKEAIEIINRSASIAFLWENASGWPVTFVSDNVLPLTGYAAHEFITGQISYLEIIHPDDRDRVIQEFNKAGTDHTKGDVIHEPFRIITKDNKVKWLSNHSLARKDKDGRITHLQGVIEDITRRKKLEADLFQAHKMEAIGTLAGGIAHDFNNMLAAILGYADLVKDDLPKDSKTRGYIDQVLKASYRAKEMVRQILTFSRKNNDDKLPLNPVPIIKEALKLLQSSLPTTIKIQQFIDPECGSIMANPSSIHQVLMNLCTNAFHAIADEQGIIDISLTQVALNSGDISTDRDITPGKFVELMVKDNGQGMEKKVLARIFEPYFTTKEVGKGSGMGLAVISGIVEGGGGFITAASTVGKGSTFKVYWPILTAKKEAASASQDAPALPHGTEHILVIDDEENITNMYKSSLQRLGYKVTSYTDSNKSLAAFMTAPDNFDLIITDQTMPNLTGADLARQVLEIRPDFPIIMATGYSSLVSREDALKIGIKEFFMKPAEMTSLAPAIRKILDARDN